MTRPLALPELPAGPFRLRAFRRDDVSVVREAASDPYIPLITTVPAHFTSAEGAAFIKRQWSRAEQRTGYSFAIADAVTDDPVGQAGLWLRDVGHGRAEIGYWVVASARGRGAAAHAVTAISQWAIGQLGLARLELHVEPWNAASVRTAERAGFCREGLLRSWQQVGGERRDMLLYSLVRADLRGTPMP